MTLTWSAISRRRALAGAATAGIGVPLLAACGDDGEGGDVTSDASTPTASKAESSARPSSSEGRSSRPPVDGVATSDVPVGGGVIEDDVVVTQPTNGEFRAFTAVCTHQQCLVTTVADGTINCPCHGSRFSIEDGSVAAGPASAPLSAVEVTVTGDRIVFG